jgi:hypothetical protein
MNRMTKVSIAVVCALGMSAAVAQTVQRGATAAGNTSKATQTVAQASTTAPVQVAQAAAGGAAGGASTGGALAGVGTAGTVGSTVVFVGSAAAGLAGTKSTTSH